MKRLLTVLFVASALISATASANKYICTVGLEGEGSFTEVYKTKEDCKKYCKGGATICEETGSATAVDIDEVD